MREAVREEGSDLLSLSLCSLFQFSPNKTGRGGGYDDWDPIKGKNFITSGLPGLIAAVWERHDFGARGQGTAI